MRNSVPLVTRYKNAAILPDMKTLCGCSALNWNSQHINARPVFPLTLLEKLTWISNISEYLSGVKYSSFVFNENHPFMLYQSIKINQSTNTTIVIKRPLSRLWRHVSANYSHHQANTEWKQMVLLFLSAFVTLRKASSCLSVCLSVCLSLSVRPSVRTVQLGYHWTDFHEF
jgi:hypothetical protein